MTEKHCNAHMALKSFRQLIFLKQKFVLFPIFASTNMNFNYCLEGMVHIDKN